MQINGNEQVQQRARKVNSMLAAIAKINEYE